MPRPLTALALALAVATCRDALGPDGALRARIAVVPVLPSGAVLGEFGLAIDGVRFVVVRPAADTLADTTLAVAPDAETLELDLRVPIRQSPETLLVSIIVLSGTTPLFTGTAPVEVTSRAQPTPTALQVETYVGPGAGVDSIAIQPRDPFISFDDSLRFQVRAFQGGAPVTQFYVAWSSGDPALAPINGFGVLRAPAARGSVRVVARTPSGASDSVTATFMPTAAQLVRITGGGQSGVVGTLLPTPLEVEARAADGLGVGGVAVRFRALVGGGAVTDTLVVTDAAGRARTTATLGSLAGGQTFEARVTGLAGSPVTFSATALAGTATQLLAAAGDGQLATVATALPIRPSVRARDAAGNPVAGVEVTFAVVSGGGGVTGTVDTTDANGLATVGSWTLGTLAGTNTLSASAASLTRAFTATGVAGAAFQLVATAGDLQSAVVGTAVATAPAVRAEDQFGNPVSGASVTFQVSGGGGNVSGASQLTNAAGVGTVGSWTLGTLAGPNALTATVSGVTPVPFSATGLPGAATTIVKLAGDLQSAVVSTAVPTPPQVRIEDQYGNPVAGFTVTVLVNSGSGSVTNPSPSSDSGGVASAESWQLGTLVGQNALTVSASGLAGSPLSFTATAVADVASQLTIFAGDGQAALPGTAVSMPPAVRVSDQFGNAVGGVAVTFTVTFGGGTIGVPVTVSSDTAGVATSSGWTLGTAGLNTLDATATGLPTVTFTADALASTATTIAHNAGTGQAGTVGTVLPTPYSVVVTDGVNPVAGVPVSWAVPAGSGSISPALDTTDLSGIASAIRTLGTVAGTQTATASVGGLTGSPVTFSATGLPDAPAQLVKQSPDPQSGTVATAVTAPVVKVTDQFGNGIQGVIVCFAVTAGSGVIGATQDTTDGSGLATAGSWTLGILVGTNRVNVTSGAVPAVIFTATGLAGAATHLAFITSPANTLAGDTIDPPVRVAFQDEFDNPVTTASGLVTIGLGAAPNAAATVTGTVEVPAVSGVATFDQLFVDSAGPAYTLGATAGALAGESPPFDAGGVIDTIPVDRLGPVAAAWNVQTKRLYVPGVEANAVSVLVDDAEITQIQGFEQPFAVAANSVTDKIYVTTSAGVVVVDGSTNAILRTIAVGAGPKGIAVDEVANRIYVAVTGDAQKEEPPALVPIDGNDDVVVTGDTVHLPGSGVGVTFNADDGFVYVAIPSRQGVVVIDPKPGGARIVADLGGGLGKGIYGVAVDVRTKRLYATNRDDNTISVIDIAAPDPNDFREIQRLPVGRLPEGLGVDAERGVVYVGNSGDNTISLIDAEKLTVFATLIVGPTPKAAVVDPVTGRVYVPTFEDDLVRVVEP